MRKIKNSVKRLSSDLVAMLPRRICNIPRKETSGIEIIVPTNKRLLRKLEKNSLVLGADEITRLQETANYPAGALNRRNGTQLTMHMAARLARILAREYAPNDPIAQDAFSSAWHFTIWTELCTLLPLRKLVPHIIEKAEGKPILLPVNPYRIDCLTWWTGHQMEPLFLAHELSRRGQQAYLLGNDFARHHARNGVERIDMPFYLAPTLWEAPEEARLPTRASDRIFGPDHVRYPEYVSRLVNDATVLGFSIDPRPYDDLLVRERKAYPAPLQVPFERTSKAGGYVMYGLRHTIPDLKQGFLRLMGPMTEAAWEIAQEAVARTGAREMHMCDLFMFDSALMAHAVCEAGGKLHLWPHSTNPIILPYHKKEWIAQATAITRSGREQWRERLDEEQTSIRSQIMLRSPSIQRPFEEGAPVSVVFFGGAGRCERMPALNYGEHLRTMRELFAKFEELPPDFRVIIKPKHNWETNTWLRSLAPKKNRFETFNMSPRSFSFTNMVFVSANFGSSALLEGMSVGIPGFVARETPVADYTILSEERQQVGTIDFVIDQIRRCADGYHYRDVARQNLAWLKSETDCG